MMTKKCDHEVGDVIDTDYVDDAVNVVVCCRKCDEIGDMEVEVSTVRWQDADE